MLKNGLIEQVIASLPTDSAESIQHELAQFIRAYYNQLSNTDLSNFAVEDLFGAALCHWELAQQRVGDKLKLRVYNPQIQQDNWQSSHTVVEIVTDDMPYLVMSLSMAITSLGLNIHQTIHPVIRVARSNQGQLAGLKSDQSNDSHKDAGIFAESMMHIEVDRISDAEQLASLEATIVRTLDIIGIANSDNAAMLETMKTLRRELAGLAASNADFEESSALFSWLDERHFSVFGIAEFTILDNLELQAVDSAALGVFSLQDSVQSFPMPRILPPDHNILFSTGQLVGISKATLRSPIARPEILDIIAVRQLKNTGAHGSVFCLLGLFAPFVKHLDTSQIPVLRLKTRAIQSNSGLMPDSHAARSLTNTLEQLPREMLFQHDTQTLLDISTGIVNLQERQRICLFGSIAPGGLHCNCLVYIPREHYGRELRLSIEAIFTRGATRAFSRV